MTTKPDLSVVEALEELAYGQTFSLIARKREMAAEALPLARSQAEKAALYDSTRAALEWLNKNFGHTLLGIMKLAQMARPDIYKDCPAIIKDMIEKEGKS